MVERKRRLSRSEFLETGGLFTTGELEEIALTTNRKKELLLVSEKPLVLAERNKEYENLVARRLLIPLVMVDGCCRCPEIQEGKFVIPELRDIRFANSSAYFDWVRRVPANTKEALPLLRLAEKGEELSPEHMSKFQF